MIQAVRLSGSALNCKSAAEGKAKGQPVPAFNRTGGTFLKFLPSQML